MDQSNWSDVLLIRRIHLSKYMHENVTIIFRASTDHVVHLLLQSTQKNLSGFGSVGRTVASGTRGPWFGSSHRLIF